MNALPSEDDGVETGLVVNDVFRSGSKDELDSCSSTVVSDPSEFAVEETTEEVCASEVEEEAEE